MHGGHVTAASNGVGHGATFAIHLPLAGEATATRELTSEGSDAKRHILVVDDNKDAADSLAALLEMDGHRVKAVYTAEAGLEQVDLLKPDLVLLDIGLPRISGYEVVQRIKAAHPLISVVAISGYGRHEDKRRAVEAGFDGHLVKPVDFDVLRQLMNEPDRRA